MKRDPKPDQQTEFEKNRSGGNSSERERAAWSRRKFLSELDRIRGRQRDWRFGGERCTLGAGIGAGWRSASHIRPPPRPRRRPANRGESSLIPTPELTTRWRFFSRCARRS